MMHLQGLRPFGGACFFFAIGSLIRPVAQARERNFLLFAGNIVS
jgi:hypothetical protein